MRLRFSHQLFLTYLVLIVAVVAALNIGADSILSRHLLTLVTDDLRREVALGRDIYDRSPNLSPDSLANLLGTLSERRVTLIDRNGTVLGDSRVATEQLAAVENHANRQEVALALRGEMGYAIRESPTVGGPHLYLAVPTGRGEVLRFAVPLSDIRAAVSRAQRGILGVGAAALLLAALLSFGVSVAVTQPLRRIGAAARDMAGGDLSRRVREHRTDELGEVGNALDSLAEELQRRIGQLEAERVEMQTLIDSMAEGVLAFGPDGTIRRANPAATRIFVLPPDARGLQPEAVSRRAEFLRLVGRALGGEKVSPVELAHDGRFLLATAHSLPGGGAVMVFLDVSELRRLEGVRRDFVANASHELKTPLTAIRGYSETLLEDDLPADLRRHFAEVVKANADRLQRIVDDLLDLSRIESGGWRVEPRLVDVEAAAREAWATVASEAEAREIRFVVDMEPGCDTVQADPGALRHILCNLFSNALRYTPKQGTVEVRSRCARRGGDTSPEEAAGIRLGTPAPVRTTAPTDWIAIEVRDTGSGIPAVHLPRIFERFYRVDPARSRAEGGTGLGLAIVKHLVEAHGGQIEAESQLGRGTTIRLLLPPGAAATTS